MWSRRLVPRMAFLAAVRAGGFGGAMQANANGPHIAGRENFESEGGGPPRESFVQSAPHAG